jgi:hypothetical protein
MSPVPERINVDWDDEEALPGAWMGNAYDEPMKGRVEYVRVDTVETAMPSDQWLKDAEKLVDDLIHAVNEREGANGWSNEEQAAETAIYDHLRRRVEGQKPPEGGN